MKLFYAHGGGLGHLTRIDRFIQRTGLLGEDILIVTPSVFRHHFPRYRFVPLDWKAPPGVWARTLSQTIERQAVREVYIDTFPFGIAGELAAVYDRFPGLAYHYLSRILKWETYLSDLQNPRLPFPFARTYLFEALYPTHRAWIDGNSSAVSSLSGLFSPERSERCSEEVYWLVVHSGGREEVRQLLAVACAERRERVEEVLIVVFTQVEVETPEPNVIIQRDVYPAHPYFAGAGRIFCGAGFNMMQEVRSFTNKLTVFPFPKKYDDQFFRVGRRPFRYRTG